MITDIWKLSKTGWHIFLNGTGEQQLAAAIALGAIIGLEKAVYVICKAKKRTKELEKRYQQLVKVSDRMCKQAQEDFSETEKIIEKTKEAEETYEKVKREIEEEKKNDPIKKEAEQLIRKVNRLLSED